MDLFILIAAVAGVAGALFGFWRITYAIKSYRIQQKQYYLQALMLIESREYWRTPKMEYVNMMKKLHPNRDINDQLERLIKELNDIFG